jgi:predicted phage terminase large subunit-like protein
MAEELSARRKAEISLHQFTKQAWPQIEGNRAFVDGWHIQAICEHLEAVARGEIRRLLINVPPRTMKSTLVSVVFPAWLWIIRPEEQFAYASYSSALSMRDSVRCRRLISSPWYQTRWGHIFNLVGDQNTKSRFENNQMGYRISFGVNSSVIGEGGNILCVDDGNNAMDGESETVRESTNLWWDTAWSIRLNDPKTGALIAVQQRIDELDLSAHIMESDINKEWTYLILPMEFESSRRAKTIILPSTNGKIWQDPREKDGDLLWPNRIGEKELKQLKASLGSEYAIAGQLQQRPAPETGGIMKKSWFQLWKHPSPPNMFQVLQSWDTALEANEMNAYSACSTWGLFYDEHKVVNVILLGVWRGRVEYPDLRKMAKRLYEDYRDDGSIEIKPDGAHIPDIVLVESKVSGISLVQDLRKTGIMAVKFDPNKYGDKILRVRKITPILEAGRVWVPARPPGYTTLRSFADTLVQMCSIFPNAESRDLVDSMTQVLLRLVYGGYLTHPDDEPRESGSTKPKHTFYGVEK